MKKTFAIFFLATGAFAFAAGVVWLFERRFETGDVYPPYSSLRSDPLGTMALLESLQQIPGLDVRRDFHQGNELPEAPGTVYLHLGGGSQEWKEIPDDLFHEIKGFLARGGRLVIAFYPEAGNARPAPPPATADKADAKKSTPAKPDEKKPDPNANLDEEKEVTHTLKEFWGIDLGFAKPAGSATQTVHKVASLPLPDKLDWHGGAIFTDVDEKWTTIYARGQDPVVVARQFGPGSVVLATDAYFLSNEALSKDRHADLLAWLIGSGRRIVFDEAHFGIVEDPGVMALVRRYNLGGLIAGLFLLALLFVWKNLSSLVPPPAPEATASYVAGLDSAAGLINLLRRNIPSKDLLKVCFAEWNKSPTGTRLAARRAAVQAMLEAEKDLPPRQRDSIQAYRRIATILKPGSLSDSKPSLPPPSL